MPLKQEEMQKRSLALISERYNRMNYYISDLPILYMGSDQVIATYEDAKYSGTLSYDYINNNHKIRQLIPKLHWNTTLLIYSQILNDA